MKRWWRHHKSCAWLAQQFVCIFMTPTTSTDDDFLDCIKIDEIQRRHSQDFFAAGLIISFLVVFPSAVVAAVACCRPVILCHDFCACLVPLLLCFFFSFFVNCECTTSTNALFLFAALIDCGVATVIFAFINYDSLRWRQYCTSSPMMKSIAFFTPYFQLIFEFVLFCLISWLFLARFD